MSPSGTFDPETAEATARSIVLGTLARKKNPPPDPTTNPVGWFDEVLGVGRWYDKQREMVTSILENRQTSVCGCNSSGKDFMAGRIALWWMARFKDEAKVVITGPTHRQVEEIVWQELRHAWMNSTRPLGGRLYESPLLRYTESKFVLGFSTDKPYQLQGLHSPHLLVIVTEAHGFAQPHMDVIHRLNPERMLLTGNPISEAGEFFESHNNKRHLWNPITISAWDTPNFKLPREDWIGGLVTPDDERDGRERWGEDNPLYIVTFKGEWVEGMGNLIVVPMSWALAAESREATQNLSGRVEVIACDVARFGRDSTVIYFRVGKQARCLEKGQGWDTQLTADRLADWHRRYPKAHLIVDAVGVGVGVVDALRRRGIGVQEFIGGASAGDSERFVNATAEVWWRMRVAYEQGLAVEPDPTLRGQVASRTYEIQTDRRIKLQTKEELQKAGKKSPDEADALAMTFVVDYEVEARGLMPRTGVQPGTPPAAEDTHRSMTIIRRRDEYQLPERRGKHWPGAGSRRWPVSARRGR